MKKVMNNNKAIIIAIVAIVSMAFTSPVIAMDKKGEPTVEIKCLGYVDNNPVFEVNISKLELENYIITIRDASGATLFSEKLTGRSFSRKYRIDTEEEIVNGGLKFEIKAASSNKTEVYAAGVSVNTTREMTINKIQ